MSIPTDLQLIINVCAIVGIVYKVGTNQGETDKKIGKVCELLEKKMSEQKVRIVKLELDLKDLEKSIENRDMVLRKEHEWAQGNDDRRIKRIFGILKELETKLRTKGIYLDASRSTHY